MTAIDRIRMELNRRSITHLSPGSDRIEVPPADASGFLVGLHAHARGFTVYFDGWHEEFTSDDEAVSCFMFGLSARCRLAVALRGDFPVKWTLEYFEDGRWLAESETGLLLQPFWRRRRVEYRTNRMPADMPLAQE